MENNHASIWTVGSGKGGVGKSACVALLAQTLARDLNVIAVDLDLSGSDLHGLLGVRHPKNNLMTFLTGQTDTLLDCVVDTEVSNVQLISCGSSSVSGIAFSIADKARLVAALESLNADVVLCDLGAGSHLDYVDFMCVAERQIMVTTGDPTSIQNTYAFIKACTLRFIELQLSAEPHLHSKYLEIMKPDSRSTITGIERIFSGLGTHHSAAVGKIKNSLQSYCFYVLPNQVFPSDQRRIQHSLGIVCRQYLGCDLIGLPVLVADAGLAANIRQMISPISVGVGATFTQTLNKIVDVLIAASPQERRSLRRSMSRLSSSFAWLNSSPESAHGDLGPINTLEDVLDRIPSAASADKHKHNETLDASPPVVDDILDEEPKTLRPSMNRITLFQIRRSRTN